MASPPRNDDAGIPKLRPRDLPSKRLLGTGLASVGYETELMGKKYARKDFMGVPSDTFRREADRLKGLEDHDNIVKTLDWIENKKSCSLVLEYMEDDLLGFLQKWKQSRGSSDSSSGNQSDRDSRSTIRPAPFDLEDALHVMVQIARGMEFLADKGIRHGNLKTKNILVSGMSDLDRNSWSVKVADFGLVRTRRKSTCFASRRARKLDMARWTAPELLQVSLLEDKGETSSESDSDEDYADSDVPEWRELGTDVYSFAVICSQILTGEDPFPNLNWRELGVEIVRRELSPTLPAACPPELRKLLVSCLGNDKTVRPSFSDICKTLQRPEILTMLALSTGRREPAVKSPASASSSDVSVPGPLRQPVTVEDLWGLDLQPPGLNWGTWFNGYPFGYGFGKTVHLFAKLIQLSRTVWGGRHGAKWSRFRKELESMLPNMLRIHYRTVALEKAVDDKNLKENFRNEFTTINNWMKTLRVAVEATSLEATSLEATSLEFEFEQSQSPEFESLLRSSLEKSERSLSLLKEFVEILLKSSPGYERFLSFQYERLMQLGIVERWRRFDYERSLDEREKCKRPLHECMKCKRSLDACAGYKRSMLSWLALPTESEKYLSLGRRFVDLVDSFKGWLEESTLLVSEDFLKWFSEFKRPPESRVDLSSAESVRAPVSSGEKELLRALGAFEESLSLLLESERQLRPLVSSMHSLLSTALSALPDLFEPWVVFSRLEQEQQAVLRVATAALKEAQLLPRAG